MNWLDKQGIEAMLVSPIAVGLLQRVSVYNFNGCDIPFRSTRWLEQMAEA